jgi:hypothetical protein
MDSLHKKEWRLEQVMPLIREQLAKGQTVRFGPHGISMLPMLRQGRDKVVLSPVNGRLKKYDLPLYQRDDGHYVLHRVVAVGDTYTCIGDNQYELEHGIRDDQIIAVVTAFVRDEKEISVKNISYQIYCRVWHYLRPVKRLCGYIRRFLRRVKRFLAG